jgi:hypothetical protein
MYWRSSSHGRTIASPQKEARSLHTNTREDTLKKPFVVIAAIALAVAGVSTVAADRVYHTSHIPFESVGGAPLKKGFVQNIHSNGPNVYAHQVHVLVGADADTTYQVFLNVFVLNPTCAGGPDASLPTTTIQTNAAGNGKGAVKFVPADVAGLRPATHGASWTVTKLGVPVYQTACEVAVLD